MEPATMDNTNSNSISNSTSNITTSRLDGRLENSLRPLSCELGCLVNCDGSCEWKSGSTTVLAGVHGPIAPRLLSHEDSARCQVNVVIKSGDANNTYEREWEVCLSQQLTACIITEYYPRTVVSVVVQVLTADGSVLAACLHAAVLALMDAGIDLRRLPVAVTCALNSKQQQQQQQQLLSSDPKSPVSPLRIQLDPVAEEEQQAESVVVVFLDNDHRVLGCHTSASMRQGPMQVLTCISTAARAVPAVHAFWRLAMEQKATRESQTLWSGAT